MSKSVLNKCFMVAACSWLLIDATAASAQNSYTNNGPTEDWAGYVITGSAYSDVSASWVVPAVDCSNVTPEGTSVSYAWAGLGGYNGTTPAANSAFEKIGTAQKCYGEEPG